MTQVIDRRTFASGWDEVAWIEEVIDSAFPEDRAVAVLEAGCGRAWTLDLKGRPFTLTGLDINQEALDYRAKVVRDLDIPILGDLRTAVLQPAAFDVIYSAYVLEHVEGADRVLENFARWAAPGGLVILRVPDRETVYGALVRHSPYRTHVWYYRHVHHIPNAGTEGRAPFPTVYEPVIGPERLRQFFAERGFEVVGEGFCRPFAGKQGRLWEAVRWLMRTLGRFTLGRLPGGHNNYTIIVRNGQVDDHVAAASS